MSDSVIKTKLSELLEKVVPVVALGTLVLTLFFCAFLVFNIDNYKANASILDEMHSAVELTLEDNLKNKNSTK